MRERFAWLNLGGRERVPCNWTYAEPGQGLQQRADRQQVAYRKSEGDRLCAWQSPSEAKRYPPAPC